MLTRIMGGVYATNTSGQELNVSRNDDATDADEQDDTPSWTLELLPPDRNATAHTSVRLALFWENAGDLQDNWSWSLASALNIKIFATSESVRNAEQVIAQGIPPRGDEQRVLEFNMENGFSTTKAFRSTCTIYKGDPIQNLISETISFLHRDSEFVGGVELVLDERIIVSHEYFMLLHLLILRIVM